MIPPSSTGESTRKTRLVRPELERLGTDSQGVRDSFEKLRRAVITHGEAEEHEELPKLNGILDEYEVRRMQDALSRVPDLASRNGDQGTSFMEQLQPARAEFALRDPYSALRLDAVHDI